MASPEITKNQPKTQSFSARRLALYMVGREPETHELLVSQIWQEWRVFLLPSYAVVAGRLGEEDEALVYSDLNELLRAEKEAMGSDLDYVDAVLTAHGVRPFRP